MDKLRLRIITPKKIVFEEEVDAVTAPALTGEITVLPNHINLFSLLAEGIIKIKKSGKEDYLAVGGGYLQTNGEKLDILVSQAYGQAEIDEKLSEKAVNEAKKILNESKSMEERNRAASLLRRSLLDMKLLRKRRHTRQQSV